MLMAKGKMPPACAFAVSVLADYDLDPDSVPEEAVEAAQQHMATCIRCLSNPRDTTPGKKRKVYQAEASDNSAQEDAQASLDDFDTSPRIAAVQQQAQALQRSLVPLATALTQAIPEPPPRPATQPPPPSRSPSIQTVMSDGPIDCQQCRQMLPEYAEAMDSGQNVAYLYPDVQDHLLTCEAGCLVLLDIFRQEAKANRKNRRHLVRNPFKIIGWEITGFFRGGQLPVSTRALSFGTLIFLLLVASLSTYLSIRWDDARYYHPPVHVHTIPTPDGIGLSDGLKIYDACNSTIYQDKRNAAQALQRGNLTRADALLTTAIGVADTTGMEQGALQIANAVATLSSNGTLQQFGLLANGPTPLLAVLGLGPSQLAQIVLPVLCRAGIPLIAPTTTGLFIIDLLTQTSLYRHCTPGFAFVRFSPDDLAQSIVGSSYAYIQLHARNAAIFYDPSNPSSQGSAQGFISGFTRHSGAHIVAQETAVASGLLDANGRPQASREDLLAGLNDALKATPRPDIIFAPLLANDVTTLAEAIAHLPVSQQPILIIGGEFVRPAALQGLVPWARKQQLTLPHIYVSLSSAARPPTNGDWQRQFYASFCTSFATPGSFCSGAAALDQGALLFADGIEMIVKGIGSLAPGSQFPTTSLLVQHMSNEKFAGVSCYISLRYWDNVLVTSTNVEPIVLGLQADGSIQIVG